MISFIRHITFCIVLALLASATYMVIDKVLKPVPEIHFSIKCFANTNIEVRNRADSTINYQGDPTKLFLYSSQFFSKMVIPFDDAKNMLRVRLDFDNISNYVMIERIYLVTKTVGKRDTISSWKGENIDSLINYRHSVQLESKNKAFIQFKCDEQDPYIEFNSAFYHQLKLHPGSVQSKILTALAAICISLTLLFIFLPWIQSVNKQKIHQWIRQGNLLLIFFMISLFAIFFNSLGQWIPDLASKENRRLAGKPSLTGSNFFEYPDSYTAYVKDNFAFRNYLFFTNSLWKAKLLGVSSLPDDAIMGKKGWFFDNETNVIKDFRRLQIYNASELDIISQILTQRKRWLDKRGIKFYILVPPNKNRVYPEYMPDSYTQMDTCGHNYLDLLKLHLKLHTPVEIIDPTVELQKAKARYDVYYSTDTHWNLFGGFIGYSVLINQIKQDFPAIHPVKEHEFKIDSYFNNEGDIAAMLGLNTIYRRKEYTMKFIDTHKTLHNPEFSAINMTYHNEHTVDSCGLKLLMFRDSYSNYLIPFLNLHFKEAHYVWSYEFLDQVIEREKPDVVIFESLQRFMSYALTSPNSERVVNDR